MAATARKTDLHRKTNETDIHLSINLDGEGAYKISTGVPFLNHMLELFTRHGFFDLTIQATGDVHIDDHHTVESVGLALGQAFREALVTREAFVGLATQQFRSMKRSSHALSISVDGHFSPTTYRSNRRKLGISQLS